MDVRGPVQRVGHVDAVLPAEIHVLLRDDHEVGRHAEVELLAHLLVLPVGLLDQAHHAREVQERLAALELEVDERVGRGEREAHHRVDGLRLHVHLPRVHRLRVHVAVGAVEVAPLRQDGHVQAGAREGLQVPGLQIFHHLRAVLRGDDVAALLQALVERRVHEDFGELHILAPGEDLERPRARQPHVVVRPHLPGGEEVGQPLVLVTPARGPHDRPSRSA